MYRQRITLWVAAGVLVWSGVANAGMTVGHWGRSGWKEAGATFGSLPPATPIWKADLGKTYRPTGGTASSKSTDFHFSSLLGGGNFGHRGLDATNWDCQAEPQYTTWGSRGDRGRFVFGRPSNYWNSSQPCSYWPTRCGGDYEWLRDWSKDRDKPCGPSVPSPGAIVLGGIGTVAVGWLRRRRSL